MKRSLSALALVGALVSFIAALAPIAEAGSLKAQVYLVQAAVPSKVTEKGCGFARKTKTLPARGDRGRGKEAQWNASNHHVQRAGGRPEFTVLFMKSTRPRRS